ncbi:lectin C-type domain protein [Ancylostoma duodenale]|uniref:Lectin C-type domain protein n=1 Tax=Ancylostoma duodenale TaxID=51022 RepID=A0A0C2FBQ8_9BILA|nr:lectin C-type domain protein [Ancylostoma duodenale]
MDFILFRSLFALCLFSVVLSMPGYYGPKPRYVPCPNGWMRFRDSCYYFERKKMTFDKAEVRCLERDSMLFMADSVEEWNAIMKHTPTNYFTWAGLKQREGEREPRWTSPGGIKATQIDWMSTGLSGWNENAKCVARYNSDASKPYSSFYFCGMDFFSVCEKNATLIHDLWDEGDRGF